MTDPIDWDLAVATASRLAPKGPDLPADEAKAALVELTSKSTGALLDFMRKKELQSMVYTLVDRERLIGAFEA